MSDDKLRAINVVGAESRYFEVVAGAPWYLPPGWYRQQPGDELPTGPFPTEAAARAMGSPPPPEPIVCFAPPTAEERAALEAGPQPPKRNREEPEPIIDPRDIIIDPYPPTAEDWAAIDAERTKDMTEAEREAYFSHDDNDDAPFEDEADVAGEVPVVPAPPVVKRKPRSTTTKPRSRKEVPVVKDGPVVKDAPRSWRYVEGERALLERNERPTLLDELFGLLDNNRPTAIIFAIIVAIGLWFDPQTSGPGLVMWAGMWLIIIALARRGSQS